MKREIPLFIFDTNKQHKKGECDFVVCTDKDSGFIARMDYIPEQEDEVGDDYRIGIRNGGLSCKMQILRMTGEHPTPTAVRSLLKKAMETYGKIALKTLNIDRPSKAECVKFLRQLAESNRGVMSERSLRDQHIMKISIAMLEHTIDYLSDE